MIINVKELTDISLYPIIESSVENRINYSITTNFDKYNYHFRSYIPVTYEGHKYAICLIAPIQSGKGKNASKRICKKAISYFIQISKQYKIERWMLEDMLLRFYKLPDDYTTPNDKVKFIQVNSSKKDDILYKGPIKRVNTVLSKNMLKRIKTEKKKST